MTRPRNVTYMVGSNYKENERLISGEGERERKEKADIETTLIKKKGRKTGGPISSVQL